MILGTKKIDGFWRIVEYVGIYQGTLQYITWDGIYNTKEEVTEKLNKIEARSKAMDIEFIKDEEFMLEQELEQNSCPTCGHQTCGCEFLIDTLKESDYPLTF